MGNVRALGVGGGALNRNYLVALGIFVVVGAALFALLALFVAPGMNYVPPTTSGDLDAATMQVAKGLYCPVCPGVPLDVCETQACQQWRALIKQDLAQGQTPAQIQAYFVEQYGERVLGAPRAQGLNLIVYILPALVVAAGASVLYLFVQKRRSQRVLNSNSPSLQIGDSNNPYRSRIERELNEND